MKKILDNVFVKIISTIIEIVVFGVLFCYLAIIILQRTTVSASVSGYRIFNVASGSMEPTIKVGDVILVKDADPSSFKPNEDIITYKMSVDGDEKLITHRFIRYEEDENGDKTLITKGDANLVEDNPIKPVQVLGKYQKTLVLVTFLTSLFRSKVGFFLFIFVPIVIYITIEVLEEHYERKDEQREEEELKKKEAEEKAKMVTSLPKSEPIDRFGEEEESHLKEVPDETREFNNMKPVVIDDNIELKPINNESVGDNSNE